MTSHLFISLDGVVEAPDRYFREDLYQDLSLFDDETVAGQGRRPLSREGEPIQLGLQSARTMPRGLQYPVFRLRT
ncbi:MULTISPECIES: hypothetical protein [Rhodanobacter]|uniref:hypothetical protein n=1 Tax=Rhodanobacter TaxID=75309 RepID=UPI000412F7A9|nr:MULTISPECIES: hypothetical protein [Rhodanobacter]TAN18022.1 MAG: hypothetical protein EPN35_05135 [Rhodanobacter sp.]UJJ54458.1 hypothetical protein LRK53_16105 [Rhodanobacter thiooxydans]